MAEDKYMLISLDDEKAKSLADVLGNKTCKRIIDHLASHPEASVKDFSDFLKMPMNTVEYNVKKLVAADLVQKRTNFFWSKKGKKIVMYELSNKSIIIAPKNSDTMSKLKSIFPAAIVSLAGAFAVYVFDKVRNSSFLNVPTSELAVYAAKGVGNCTGNGVGNCTGNSLMAAAPEVQRVASDTATNVFNYAHSLSWMWFLGGAVLALFIFSIVNWRKL